jgi:PPM family protein phosphatase
MADTPRTTCVACIIQDDAAFWAHAGDSRLYLIRNGQVVNRTRDHSKVQYLVDNGLISAEDANRHPDRNKVFSCLGGMIEPNVDFSPRSPLLNDDTIVLCTDGMWSSYADTEFANAFSSGGVQHNATAMLNEAERRAGVDCDNLSVIALKWASAVGGWSEGVTTQTSTLALGEFSTQMERTLTLSDPESGRPALSEAEIEKAVQEITETLKRHGSKNDD